MRSKFPSNLCIALSICMLTIFATPLHAVPGRFFARFSGGANLPTLSALNDELAIQGQDKVAAGYGLGASFGYTLFDERYSLELHFALTFYPDFDYDNAYEYFPAGLRHYSYFLVARHNFMSESERFRPTLGAGIGYGQTSLIAGGGRLSAPEGLLTGSFDVKLRSNLDLGIECSYAAGLQTKEFGGPFLENVDTDKVLTSAGIPLEDRFRSFDVRIGLTIWLKPVTQ